MNSRPTGGDHASQAQVTPCVVAIEAARQLITAASMSSRMRIHIATMVHVESRLTPFAYECILHRLQIVVLMLEEWGGEEQRTRLREGEPVSMGVDPYTSGMIVDRPRFTHASVVTAVVAVLRAFRDERELMLIPQRTRCIREGEVHEILLTDETGVAPSSVVNRVAGVAFVEVVRGGVVLQGDRLRRMDRAVGELVGFDETHAPNHINFVISAKKRASGEQMGLGLGEWLVFEQTTE